MKHFTTRLLVILALLSVWPNISTAVNNAPADAAVVVLRTSCFENGVEIKDCFDSMFAVDNWLRTVRQTGPSKPTLVNIGPGTFDWWRCQSSHVTLRGSGRDQTIIANDAQAFAALTISSGCTQLNVQDLKIKGTDNIWGILVQNLSAVTAWTNVDVESRDYGWVEGVGGPCTNPRGRHFWFSSRIRTNGLGFVSRAYRPQCAESWFWGSEVTAVATPSLVNSIDSVFAVDAIDAEVHFYGSNIAVKVATGVDATNKIRLVHAAANSEVHIHGTGLDVIHDGTGTVNALEADASSHFHANESAYNVHIGGTGKVTRLAGAGPIDSPYHWGPRTAPPAIASRNGADSYIETDCPQTGACSGGGTFPRTMLYRTECTGTGANQGTWFDTVTNACRQ